MIRKHLLEIVLVESDGEHDEDTGGHSEELEDDGQPVGLLLRVGGDGVRVTRGQFGHHVDQGHVQKYPCKEESRLEINDEYVTVFSSSPAVAANIQAEKL